MSQALSTCDIFFCILHGRDMPCTSARAQFSGIKAQISRCQGTFFTSLQACPHDIEIRPLRRKEKSRTECRYCLYIVNILPLRRKRVDITA